MAAKTYEIAFKLAGKMSSDFSKTFQAANKAITGFNGSLTDLNKQAANIDKVVKLRKETGLAARSYVQAKQKVAELGRAMSASEAPTQKMISDFNRAKVAVDKAKVSLERKKTALKEVETAAGTTGVKLQTLITRQNELAKSADKARLAQEKLAKLTEQNQKLSNLQGTLKSNAMSSAGSLAGMAATATGTVGLPVKQAMQMEDAMAEVRKVTNFTPEGLIEVQKEIEKMSTRIPMTAEGLASIMASAAQSGVAQKDLLEFTEQAAKMGIAFDITAEEAGTMMAKWQSGMGLSLDRVYSLADATNELSNNNAATASQIGEVLKRYGALGKVAGLTEKQTAAFAASVISSGAQAEVASTGIKAFMRAMSKGGSMSKKQVAAFQNVGLNPKQLQKQLQEDAPAAIISTLEAIQKKIPKEKWNQYLSAMFGEEASVAVGPMMSNLEGLKENFKLVGDEAGYSDSMLKEFQSRSATTSNALQLARNAATYAARALGQPLLDPLKKLSEEFVKVAVNVGKWIKDNEELVIKILKVAGAVTGLIAGFHAVRLALFFLVSPILSVIKGINNLRMAYAWLVTSGRLATVMMKAQAIGMKVWRGIMLVSTTTLGLLRKGMAALNLVMRANPIGLVITALAGLIAIGVYVYKNFDQIKQKVSELWASFSEKFPGIAGFVSDAYENTIKPVIEGMQKIFGGLIEFIKGVFSGEWATAWEGIKTTFSGVWESLVGIAKAPLNAVISMINGVIGGINKIGSVELFGKTIGINIPKIPQLANGGVATRPTLAMIGEGREDEAVLPLSKLKGMLGGTGGGMTVNFAPTINVTGGNGNAYAEVERGLKEGQQSFKKELERLLQNQRRLSYV